MNRQQQGGRVSHGLASHSHPVKAFTNAKVITKFEHLPKYSESPEKDRQASMARFSKKKGRANACSTSSSHNQATETEQGSTEAHFVGVMLPFAVSTFKLLLPWPETDGM